MDRAPIRRLARQALLAACAVLALGSPAQAISINDGAGDAVARALGAPFTGVVQLSFTGFGGFCSGSLISPNAVITAEHCTSGLPTSLLSVEFRDSDPASTLLATRGVTSKFEIVPTNDLGDGTDIALLTLDSPVTGIDPLGFFIGDPTGLEVTEVGFGLHGPGSTGGTVKDDIRRAVENVADFFGPAAFLGGTLIAGTDNLISADHDDGSDFFNTLAPFGSSADPLDAEGNPALGDSGGPLLIEDGGEFLIAGLLTAGTTPGGEYGDISYWTGTEAHRDVIESFGGIFGATVATPEPGTLALFAFGLAGIGFMRRRADHA